MLLAQQRRRRRRRQQESLPLSADLRIDDRIKQDVGILSKDLFRQFFLKYQPFPPIQNPRYVAITPWLPDSIVASSICIQWTILAVESTPIEDKEIQSNLLLPSNCTALPSFLRSLKHIAPSNLSTKKDSSFRVRIMEVIPIGLQTIGLTIQSDAMRKHFKGQAQFGGGFQPQGKQKLKSAPSKIVSVNEEEMERTLRITMKDALSSLLLHSGDQLHLKLPTHPITHVSAPPASIFACDPVGQGKVLPSTRVVVFKSQDKKAQRMLKNKAQTQLPPPAKNIDQDEEDTSNEQFHSAAESPATPASPELSDTSLSIDLSDSQSATTQNQDDLSDDSDEIISLLVPGLPPHTSGVLSSLAGGSPRIAGSLYSNNIGSPASVHSGFSSSTLRGGSSQGRVFVAQGLLKKIPDDLLHPTPAADEDDEARVYVESSSLIKLSCFSGDWVNLEPALGPYQHAGPALASWTQAAFQQEPKALRPFRVYALPDAKKPLSRYLPSYNVLGHGVTGSNAYSDAPTVFVPPVLLANLHATHLKLCPLSVPVSHQTVSSVSRQKAAISASSMPPVATQVTIVKVLSPLSQDIELQSILFAALQSYFGRKKRIVTQGDFIGVAFDESLGRVFHQPGNDALNEDLYTLVKRRQTNPSTVTWFKVGPVLVESCQTKDLPPSPWGQAACVTASSTRLMLKTNEPSRIPSALTGTWQYYYGLKKMAVFNSGHPLGLPSALPKPKTYISELQKRIQGMIAAYTSAQAVHRGLPPMAILLTSTQRQIGKITTISRICQDLGLHSAVIDPYMASSNSITSGETEDYIKQRAQRLLSCGAENTVIIFRHIDVFASERMASNIRDILKESRVIIATTLHPEKLAVELRALFTYEIAFQAPDKKEREGMLRDMINATGLPMRSDVQLSSLALQTAALVAGNLTNVVSKAVGARERRLVQIADSAATMKNEPITDRDVEIAGGDAIKCITQADFESAVERARKNYADSIGAPKIPNVGWDDVGGLAHVKAAVFETIQLPLTRPELFEKGMKKRSGILFYGPPGTGKTLVAKAIATEFSLNFISIKGPELLNMYIGESEANVRRVFLRAQDARPCVVFFDELDSVAPKRGKHSDSGGVMDRIVSQLLAELDGMNSGEDGRGGVFVIGATNRPDLLDQALLRPGRFDKMLYLGISDTHEKQLKVLEALTRKFTLDADCSLEEVANILPFTYTGADLYALCSDAKLKAITRQCRQIDENVARYNATLKVGQSQLTVAQYFDRYATDAESNVTVTEEDFHAAHEALIPSVSAEEFGHYERVRRGFEGSKLGKENENEIDLQEEKKQHKARSNGEMKTKEREKDRSKGKGRAIEPLQTNQFGSATNDDYEMYE